jgi:hypothetical protein
VGIVDHRIHQRQTPASPPCRTTPPRRFQHGHNENDTTREALRHAEDEVARIQAKLRAALADQDVRGVSADDKPRRLEWADGVAEAHRRYGKGKAAGAAQAADQAAHGTCGATSADGMAEARRRYPAASPASADGQAEEAPRAWSSADGIAEARRRHRGRS